METFSVMAIIKPILVVAPLGALFAATTLLYQWFNSKNNKNK